MSCTIEETFVGDSAGDGHVPTADICEEFGRAERNIDTRRHWKKRDSLSGVYIYICLSTCTRQLLLMYYMHAQQTFAP